MKVLAYCPILYGKEYLREAILSVLPVVDRIIFLYTSVGSYGHQISNPCPETEEELKTIALSFPGTEWISGRYVHEGEHRSQIFKHLKGEDLILGFDADEVYDTESLLAGLETAFTSGRRNHGVNGYINFFRNFHSECKDGFRPIRIINPHIADSEFQRSNPSEVKIKIYHFGNCQSLKIMEYKWNVHGHKDELRTNWLEDIYLSGKVNDVHPVARGLWNVVPYNKEELPMMLKRHPNFNKDFVK